MAAVGAGCRLSGAAAALSQADDGQPGQEGGGVRQRHRGKLPTGRPRRPRVRVGRTGPGSAGLHPWALEPSGPRGAGSPFRLCGCREGGGAQVSPSLPPPHPSGSGRRARPALHGDPCLLPCRGRLHAPRWAIWLKGRRVEDEVCVFAKGFVAPGRRCVKRGKTQRPSFSCVGTEWEAGNGFKEKKKKGSTVSASLSPLAVLRFCVFFSF